MGLLTYRLRGFRYMAYTCPQYENTKRINRGNRAFRDALIKKIQQNDPIQIFELPLNKLIEKLTELSNELLNENTNTNHGNYWHNANTQDNNNMAEAIVIEVSNDIQFMNSDAEYNAYIDFIRANTQADQLTDDDYLKRPQAEPGTSSIMPDLYIELLKATYETRQAGFEVHTAANFPVLPTAISNPNVKSNRKQNKKPHI